MQKAEHGEPALNPNWVMFWQKVKAAADELRRIEAKQTEDNPII